MEKTIELDNVDKVYSTGKATVHALKKIKLSIDSGEFVCIAGPSGSGKSTMLNVVGCLDAPTSGKVLLKKQNVHSLDDDKQSELRNREIGFIFQSFNLIPVLNVYENIEFPLIFRSEKNDKKVIEDKIKLLINEVGLEKEINHRPNELSGGQQQRVAIARALITEPKIVLADEPTANLDSVTSEKVIELMKKLNIERKTTFVFSTHDPLVLKYANRVITLKDGAIVGDERKVKKENE